MTTQLGSMINGSAGNGGFDGNGPSHGPTSITADGRFAAFISTATNLASPLVAQFQQAYLRDTCTGAAPGCTPATRMVSLTNSGNEPNSMAVDVAIGAQGRYAVFVSEGTNLVPNVTVAAQAYIRDTCQGPSGAIPGCTPFTALVSADNQGNPGNDAVSGIAVSANGRFVSFSTRASLFPGTPFRTEVYVRDTCINVINCTPSTSTVSVDNGGQPAPTTVSGISSISDDGRVIGFFSVDPLASNNSTGWNLYLRDTCQNESGPVAGCSASTITASVASNGSPANAQLANAFNPHVLSGTGRFAVFNSMATNLVASGTLPTASSYGTPALVPPQAALLVPPWFP